MVPLGQAATGTKIPVCLRPVPVSAAVVLISSSSGVCGVWIAGSLSLNCALGPCVRISHALLLLLVGIIHSGWGCEIVHRLRGPVAFMLGSMGLWVAGV